MQRLNETENTTKTENDNAYLCQGLTVYFDSVKPSMVSNLIAPYHITEAHQIKVIQFYSLIHTSHLNTLDFFIKIDLLFPEKS